MNETTTELEKVAGWWAASNDADHEQVTLYRKENGSECLLDRFTVTRDTMPTLEDFQLEVKKNFGGGVFVAAVRGERGEFRMRHQFAIAGLPKREAAPDETKPQGNDMTALLAAMQQQNQQNQQILLAALEKMNAKPEGDQLEKTLGYIGLLQKTMQQPARSSLDGLREFMEFKTLARELAGDEAPKADGFADLLKAALPILGEVAKNGTELEKVKATVALKREQLARTNPPTPAPQRPRLSPEVAEQLSQLLSLAGVMPADELAAVVAEQLDDEQAQAVVDAIDGGDWLADLIEHEPRAKDHAEWLETFAAKLLELLTDEPEPDTAAADSTTPQGSDAGAGQSGHPADAAVNGGTGPARQPASAGKS